MRRQERDTDPSPLESQAQVGWLDSMVSSMAAAFGVQSQKNRMRDFEHGDVKKFVISGIALTFIILFGLAAVVKIVLLNA